MSGTIDPLSPKLSVGNRGLGKVYFFECPACECLHSVDVGTGQGPQWTFDGNIDAPTFTPSVNYVQRRCHFFVRAGRFEFCGDSAKLAGQTVEMPEINPSSADRTVAAL